MGGNDVTEKKKVELEIYPFDYYCEWGRRVGFADQKKKLLPRKTYKEKLLLRFFLLIQDKVIPEFVEMELKMSSDMPRVKYWVTDPFANEEWARVEKGKEERTVTERTLELSRKLQTQPIELRNPLTTKGYSLALPMIRPSYAGIVYKSSA
ncbi:hypothetical protein HAX54_007587 [Datura stramonium]|uniref:Uncharacterized protein n=1 Tax=Datura stramonium TaxID=4076 RepID=A0ABS8RVN0_DATST|nr:hypothetical protein [Datura stramonium]